MGDVLSALDATFLELEEQNEGAVMSIGGVMVFEPRSDCGTPSMEEVRARLGRRLARLPRYSQRLSSAHTRRLAWPRWVSDEHFDVRDHISHAALPAPGGPGELCDWTADFYSHRLDRTRPLWEVVLVDGLANGRWALAHKTHHCLVDGVGSVEVASVLLDPEPTPPATPPPAAGGSLRRASAPASLEPVLQATAAGAHAARAGAHAAFHPREALERSRSLAELLIRDELIAAPHTSLNVPIGSSRRYAVISVPLRDLKTIGHELGGSVNDVVLAACTTGLRRLLLARGGEPTRRGMRAMVPMNMREASEHLALGNHVSSLFVDLPVAEADAGARYRQIAASTARLKASGAALGASTALDLTALAPPVLHALFARSVYARRLFNVTITNVPGPQVPLYAFGARLLEVHPVVPLAADHAVGIAVFSCDGVASFGVMADCESVPDLAELAHGIEDGVEELLALVVGVEQLGMTRRAQ